MAAPDTFKWDQTFGNGMRNLFPKQLIKCPRILSTSKRASIGDFPSKRLLRRNHNSTHQFVFGQAKADDEFLYTVLV